MILSCPSGNRRSRSFKRKTLVSCLAASSFDQVKVPSTKPMTGSSSEVAF